MARDLIFISYRHSDAGAQAGRLAAELKRRFGEEGVFFDTESILGGQPFPGRIREGLDRAMVVLVVIGKGWLSALDEDSRRRIDDPEDWVRQEVVEALALQDGVVIPVLVDGAKMPRAKALPDDLAQLASRHFMPLEHAQFNSHAEQIADRIFKLRVERRQPPPYMYSPPPVGGSDRLRSLQRSGRGVAPHPRASPPGGVPRPPRNPLSRGRAHELEELHRTLTTEGMIGMTQQVATWAATLEQRLTLGAVGAFIGTIAGVLAIKLAKVEVEPVHGVLPGACAALAGLIAGRSRTAIAASLACGAASTLLFWLTEGRLVPEVILRIVTYAVGYPSDSTLMIVGCALLAPIGFVLGACLPVAWGQPARAGAAALGSVAGTTVGALAIGMATCNEGMSLGYALLPGAGAAAATWIAHGSRPAMLGSAIGYVAFWVVFWLTHDTPASPGILILFVDDPGSDFNQGAMATIIGGVLAAPVGSVVGSLLVTRWRKLRSFLGL